MNAPKTEQGTALIAALLLVALMAAVSVQLVDLTRFSVFRTAQIDQRAQAYWQVRGARDFAETAFLASGDPQRTVMRSDEAWLAGPQVFPIEGGRVIGRVRDGNNCLNINALVRSETDEGAASSDAVSDQALRAQRAFVLLLERLGAPPSAAERVRAQVMDWIDADSRPEPGGAEDRDYAVYTPPYRSANRMFVELEELLALPDVTPSLFAAMRPYLCVRPVRVQPALNVNTLHLDQAPLLYALLGGVTPLGDVESVLFRRPPAGYEAVEEFWADPALATRREEPELAGLVTLRSRWFDMDLSVRLDEARMDMVQLAELTEAGDLQRRWQRVEAY